ncbi:helix-turn-helix domain-containing protein [Paramaledivibacter caminithermalis]|jgi:transcriptional regulator with XRE-family HTH domain|uniref:DNA-binding transcriptional regulator, XRE-family HTH domain n=1 Tax=Paramaledivibacter caminithermalis (strain DSM 15212 / CIP 107654 / DViRD3) TaxID=1121301 RepID=A0A1M6TE07_PARC5|nr:helix-turn-helix transcriptional regulator [Paramaledivibacter caminithermalis]SHK55066.1 DNA-binding transcriptional regulator, XRE-family HTH domain [Paramaledivibacter caminithermalis DSM 15212]
MKFGDRLRELRKEKGLTQAELAKIFSLGESTISFYESNKRTPDYELLKKIADFFDTSIDYLLCRTDKRKPPKDIYTTKELVHLLPEEYREVFRNLKIKHIKFIKKMYEEEIDPEALLDAMRVVQSVRKDLEEKEKKKDIKQDDK